jgi:hypothetical protein
MGELTMDFGELSVLQRGRNFVIGIDTVDRGCWGFWAWRARISVDILGLGAN